MKKLLIVPFVALVMTFSTPLVVQPVQGNVQHVWKLIKRACIAGVLVKIGFILFSIIYNSKVSSNCFDKCENLGEQDFLPCYFKCYDENGYHSRLLGLHQQDEGSDIETSRVAELLKEYNKEILLRAYRARALQKAAAKNVQERSHQQLQNRTKMGNWKRNFEGVKVNYFM